MKFLLTILLASLLSACACATFQKPQTRPSEDYRQEFHRQTLQQAWELRHEVYHDLLAGTISADDANWLLGSIDDLEQMRMNIWRHWNE